LNLRIPAEQDSESCAVGQAWLLPHEQKFPKEISVSAGNDEVIPRRCEWNDQL